MGINKWKYCFPSANQADHYLFLKYAVKNVPQSEKDFLMRMQLHD